MKPIVIIWTQDGEADLRHFYNQCEDQEDGAGDDFAYIVDSALELVRNFPEMAPWFEPPFRRLLVYYRRLGLFYTFEGGRVFVHGIEDLRRDPEQVRKKLGLSPRS